MELVGRLAGGVAHDFNNLLTAVLGHLELLRDEVSAEGPHQELLAAIENAATQAAALSQNLLAFLRKEPRGPAPVDLNAVVEQITSLLRRTIDPRSRSLSTSCRPCRPWMRSPRRSPSCCSTCA